MDNDFPMLEKEDFKPLYAQLSDAITQHILKKDLKPGDPIPSESDLINHTGVSRATVRQAIQRLATEGIIQKVQGKGTFVAEQKFDGYIAGAKSLEEKLGECGVKVDNILLESTIEHPTPLFLKDLDLPPGSKTHKIRRLKLVDGKPFCIEIRNFPIDIAQRFSSDELNKIPSVELLNRNPETEVHDINFRVRGSVLLEREAGVLQAPVDTPVLIQFMTHYNVMKRAVMTGRLTFLAEKVEICFEFHKNGQDQRKILIR